jgi:hypothetical protein
VAGEAAAEEAAAEEAADVVVSVRQVVQLEVEEQRAVRLRFRPQAERRNWRAALLPQRVNAEARVARVVVDVVEPLRLLRRKIRATSRDIRRTTSSSTVQATAHPLSDRRGRN